MTDRPFFAFLHAGNWLRPSGATSCRILWLLTTALLLSACVSLPESVERTPSFVLEDNRDTLLWRQLQPLVEENPELSGFHILGQGEDAYASRLRLVMAAEKSLDLQYYIWHSDLTGRVLHEMLLQAADRGVRVRLLLDDLDTAGKDDVLFLLDAHPNLEIRLFNPFSSRERRARDFVADTRRINRRMHNKTLTADNVATIFGGRNIGDEYFAATEDLDFGDMDALAVGPIVQEVSEQFDLYWNSEWVYPLAAFAPEQPPSQAQIEAARLESRAFLEAAGSSRYAQILMAMETSQIKSLGEFEYSWSEWMLAYDQPSKVEAGEVSSATHLAPKLAEGMQRTREELIIVSPYFVPGEDLTAYLIGLVDKGVQVRILTNSLQANDVPLVHAGYMRYRKDLVAGGVTLYEFKAAAHEAEGKYRKQRNRIGASRSSLHAKLFGFDRRYIFVGSFNLDPRSIALNTELGAYFESPELAQYLSDVFETDILAIAYQVELDEDGKIEWVTMEEGELRRVSTEPDTTAWKRFSTRFMSLIVPESQL